MIRKLLTSTALVALLSAGAVAQDAPATPETPMQTAPMDKPVDATNGMTETTMSAPMVMSKGYSAVDSDHLASVIIGMPVYSSAANDAENFGDINDLVVNNQGDIVAVVIGVGGFLGLGEKGVSVDYSELQWTTAEDGTERIVLNTTKEALESAPTFEWRDDMGAANPAVDPAAANNNGMMAPANPEGTAAEPVANPDGTAMDRSTMTDFDEMSVTAEELKGTAVYGTNDEQIGTIGDFVLGEDGKTVDAVIVDVGGFLGLGKKPVAVGFENLNFSVDANNNRYLFLNTTKEQLEAQPEFNPDTYTTERDTQRMVVNP